MILEQLWAAFKLSDLSYRDLAKHLRMSRPSIYRKLHGDRPMTVDELETTAALLGCSVSIKKKRRRRATG